MHNRIRKNSGFTLLELLVVIAITAILMGLVLYPVVQSFQMTRSAQAMVDSQDAARQAMRMMSRDLGEAMFVFDNAVSPVTINPDSHWASFTYHSGQQGPIQLPVRQPSGDIECFTLQSGKIDFILPRITMHCTSPQHPDTEPRDYPRGEDAWPPCPVCGSTNVEAKPTMPLQTDTTVVRYFLGLKYNDPQFMPGGVPPTDDKGIFGWKSPWSNDVADGEENQVVLYRVEFDPHDDRLFPATMSVDERLSDPMFFYRADTNSAGAPFCERWMQIAHVVGVGKYEDLVTADIGSNKLVTAVQPSITLKFKTVDNDTLSGTYSQDVAFEYGSPAPTVFEANYGYWAPNSYNVTVFRNKNTIAYTSGWSGNDFVVFRREYSGSGWSSPAETFNVSKYLSTGEVTSGSSNPVEMAFVPQENTGKVIFAIKAPRLDGEPYPCILDPWTINKRFEDRYNGNSLTGAVSDRGDAQRLGLLTTFDNNEPDYYQPNARVVPGSEKVLGPDMTPGPYQGRKILYERVPLVQGDPGLNQYTIDYDTGIIKFSPVPDHRIPETYSGAPTKIFVDYKIYFNKRGDVVKADYTTKSLVTIHLGMRMFDPETAKPHVVDLTSSVKVRNALR